MIQGAFQHRSGRIIAFGRAVLALFFLLIIWADRTQPAISTAQTYAFLAAYAVLALALLALTWNNWWLETRLAAPAHVVDLLVFTLLNHVTEGYTSPYFTFFVFLLLSASIRWGWPQTAATAAAIIILYLFEGVTASTWGTEAFHLSRFLIRSSYLLVLSSMIMLWFASNQRPPRPALVRQRDDAPRRDMEAVLAFAASRFPGARALLAWSDSEEPWLYVAELDGGGFRQARFDPDAFGPLVAQEAGNGVLVFDQVQGRVLRRLTRRKGTARLREPLNPLFAGRFGIDQGVRIPIQSNGAGGDLFVLQVAGLCSDDLALAEEVGEQVSAALQEGELFQATEEAAAMRARLSLARDIHDSVAQFLAGLAFRMEGLRKSAGAGRDLGGEIDDLQSDLVREQQDLRRLIAELRTAPVAPAEGGDFSDDLGVLAARMASQWGVELRVRSGPDALDVPVALQHDIEQLLREAVANAVRHGAATSVEADLTRCSGTLELAIADNGRGFPVAGSFGHDELSARRIGPRSLRERVEGLGGTLSLASTGTGTRLVITLPAGEGAQ
jgi:signal transduction histidine kinase